MKKQIGEKIKQLRKMRGLTQIQLSRMIGKKTAAYLNFIEKGARNISLVDFINIIRALNITIDFFFSDFNINNIVGNEKYEIIIVGGEEYKIEKITSNYEKYDNQIYKLK